MIYNQAISAQQITALYQSAGQNLDIPQQVSQGLVAGYNFDSLPDDGSFSDISGNGNTADPSDSGVSLTPFMKTATFTTSDLPAGVDQITAVYQPADGCEYPANTSEAVNETVVVAGIDPAASTAIYWYPSKDPNQINASIWSDAADNWNTSASGNGTQEVWQADDLASFADASGTIDIEGQVDASAIDLPAGGTLTPGG